MNPDRPDVVVTGLKELKEYVKKGQCWPFFDSIHLFYMIVLTNTEKMSKIG